MIEITVYDIEGRELANLIFLSHEWPPSYIHICIESMRRQPQDLATDSNYLIYFSMLYATAVGLSLKCIIYIKEVGNNHKRISREIFTLHYLHFTVIYFNMCTSHNSYMQFSQFLLLSMSNAKKNQYINSNVQQLIHSIIYTVK